MMDYFTNNFSPLRFFKFRRFRTLVLYIVIVVTIIWIYLWNDQDSPNNHKFQIPVINRSSENSFTEITESKGHEIIVHSTPLDRVAVIGIDVSFSMLQDFKEEFDYLLILPRATTKVFSLTHDNEDDINTDDKHSVSRLVEFLDSHRRGFDGATCTTALKTSNTSPIEHSCHFEVKSWTILIRKLKQRKNSQFAECNIIENAFVIRRSIFETLYFNPSYGSSTLLDFYLRSKGNLKLFSINDCIFSSRLNERNRGSLEGSPFFTDYIYLGKNHNIVRIVRENEITWTKCTVSLKICPEKTYNRTAALSKQHLPVCCSHVLNKMLHATVEGLGRIGLDYRITYGTLLGAVRSGSIIPWTNDVDLALKENDYFHEKNFEKLENILEAKKYGVVVYKGQRRVVPLFPPTKRLTFSPFKPTFQKKLFRRKMLGAMKRLLSAKTRWMDLGYLDFYIGKKEYFESLTAVQINGRSYSTFVNMTFHLKKWYGPNIYKPVKKLTAPIEIDIVKRKKQREKEKRKKRGLRRKRNTEKNRRKHNIKKDKSIQSKM